MRTADREGKRKVTMPDERRILTFTSAGESTPIPVPSPPDPDDEMRLSRRVQRTGHSSLSVTLPRSWIDESNLRPGDIVRFRKLEGGRLELSRSPVAQPPVHTSKTLTIDVGVVGPNLLARMLVGAYITGHHRVVIHGEAPLTEARREEIRATVRKILGASVIEESDHVLEVEISVDPTQHDFARLMRRIVHLLEVEIGLCRRSLAEGNRAILNPITSCEDEIDRLYMLMVRQLLLASDDFQVAREVGVLSHHYQIGSRAVAKMLEMVGDLVYDAAETIRKLPVRGGGLPSRSIPGLDRAFAELERFLKQTAEAFVSLAPADANGTLNEMERWLKAHHEGDRKSTPPIANGKGAGSSVLRISWDLANAVEMLVMINEISLNRALEPENVLRAGTTGHFLVPAVPTSARPPPTRAETASGPD
ncbi:MAG: AbrB/MazE/SpoVT family DNA-binding domain-containing protein [Thermoplasmata archaeon]